MDKCCVTQYRSEGLPPGAFRQLGTIHLHIDGAGQTDLVTSLIKQMEMRGCPGKLTAVGNAVAGPQRLDHPETYASHTPGTDQEEQLEYFSTTAIENRAQAVKVMKQVLPQVTGHQGVVLELERVVATIASDQWTEVPFGAVSPIEGHEVGYKKNVTLPFEIHHAFDVPVGTSPLELTELLQDTTNLGIRVGGWFTFVKEEQWSYRSNAFVKTPHLQEYVQHEHDALGNYLRSKGLSYRTWTLVEEVLGIWRTPLLATSSEELAI